MVQVVEKFLLEDRTCLPYMVIYKICQPHQMRHGQHCNLNMDMMMKSIVWLLMSRWQGAKSAAMVLTGFSCNIPVSAPKCVTGKWINMYVIQHIRVVHITSWKALLNLLHTLRPRQNMHHFKVWKAQSPINNKPTLFQIMAWLWSGDKPFSEPVIV